MKPEIINKISEIIRAKADRSYTHLFFTGGKQTIIAHPLNPDFTIRNEIHY